MGPCLYMGFLDSLFMWDIFWVTVSMLFGLSRGYVFIVYVNLLLYTGEDIIQEAARQRKGKRISRIEEDPQGYFLWETYLPRVVRGSTSFCFLW